MRLFEPLGRLARRGRSAFGPELVLMLGRSLGFAVTFFIPVVLVRVFDQATFGTYKQLFLVFSTLYWTVQVGMAESLFYFVPKEKDGSGRYVANSVLMLAIFGAAAAAVLAVAAHPIAAWMNNASLAAGLPWVGGMLFLMLVAAGFEIVLIARERYAWSAASYGMSDLLRSLLFVVPALLTGRLVGVLAGGVVFGMLRVGAMLGYFGGEFRRGFRPDGAALRAQLAYALPFGAAVLIEILQGNLHQYVISARFDAATFAIYAVGCLQIPFVDFVAGPAGNVMMVRMSETRLGGDGPGTRALWHQTTVKLATVFFPLVAVLLVLSRDLIVVLFTQAYAASVPIFMAWTLSILFPVFQTDGFLRVHAETRYLLLVNIVRLVFILGTIAWFLDTFGMLGAVLVTLAAMLVAKVMMLARIRRLLGTDLADLLPWRALLVRALLAAAAAAPAWIVSRALYAHPLAGLMAAGATYAAAYLAGLVLTRYRPPAAGGAGALDPVGLVGG